MLTNRYQLPIPMDRPITGQDLLDVINGMLDPILDVVGRMVVGRVDGLAPLTVRVHNKTVPGWTNLAYVPVLGDKVLCMKSESHTIILALA